MTSTAKALAALRGRGAVFEGWLVGVVVPARDEAPRIGAVIETMPRWVDRIVVIDDGSRDGTGTVASRCLEGSPIDGEVVTLGGMGVGAAIDAGHRRLAAFWLDASTPWCSVVMAGDGQMDPADLAPLLRPLVVGLADHAKGDRAAHPEGLRSMPLRRRVGTALLGFWTSLACGRSIRDPQCGYTATSGSLLSRWDWSRDWPGYGYPNHWLMRLTEMQVRIAHVPVRAIYEGAPSGLRIRSFALKVAPALLAGLHRRGWTWYVRGEWRGSERWPIVALWGLGVLSILSREAAALAPLAFAAAHLFDRKVVAKVTRAAGSVRWEGLARADVRVTSSDFEETLKGREAESGTGVGA